MRQFVPFEDGRAGESSRLCAMTILAQGRELFIVSSVSGCPGSPKGNADHRDGRGDRTCLVNEPSENSGTRSSRLYLDTELSVF